MLFVDLGHQLEGQPCKSVSTTHVESYQGRATYALGVIESEPSCNFLGLKEVAFGDMKGLLGVEQIRRQTLAETSARRLNVSS